MLDQVAVALVGVLGAREARVLAHRPEAVAVHAVVDAAREGVLARLAEALLEARRHVAGVVEPVDLDARVREAPVVVGADDRVDVAMLIVGEGLGLLFLVGAGRLRLLGRTGPPWGQDR